MLGLWNEIGKRSPWLLLLTLMVAFVVVYADEASARRAIDLRQVKVRALADSRNECKRREIKIEFGIKLRQCESWLAYPCFRDSLARPDYGYCWGSILLDDKRGYSILCKRKLRYRAPARGGLRRVASPGWACYRSGGGLTAYRADARYWG